MYTCIKNLYLFLLFCSISHILGSQHSFNQEYKRIERIGYQDWFNTMTINQAKDILKVSFSHYDTLEDKLKKTTKAYKKLARIVHSDRNRSNNRCEKAKKATQKVNKAFEVIKYNIYDKISPQGWVNSQQIYQIYQELLQEQRQWEEKSRQFQEEVNRQFKKESRKLEEEHKNFMKEHRKFEEEHKNFMKEHRKFEEEQRQWGEKNRQFQEEYRQEEENHKVQESNFIFYSFLPCLFKKKIKINSFREDDKNKKNNREEDRELKTRCQGDRHLQHNANKATFINIFIDSLSLVLSFKHVIRNFSVVDS